MTISAIGLECYTDTMVDVKTVNTNLYLEVQFSIIIDANFNYINVQNLLIFKMYPL